MGREVTHFERLAELLRLEEAEEHSRSTEQLTEFTLLERRAKGFVWTDWEATDETSGLGGRTWVTLALPGKALAKSAPHQGDVVEVRPRKADTTGVTAVVGRASLSRIDLVFERPPPPYVFEGRLRLDLRPNDVTYARARAALAGVREFERTAPKKFRVLLGNEPPRFGNLSRWEPIQTLNAEQRQAVSLALSAEDFALIHGPPGTGKSTVLAEVTAQLVRQGKRVLCTAASNAAVDRLLELSVGLGLPAVRIGHPARVSERLQPHTLDAKVESHPDRILAKELFDEGHELLGYARRQRLQGRSRERFAKAWKSKSSAYSLFDQARLLERKAVDTILSQCRVFCATLSSIEGGPLADLDFDLCIVDEATQAIEPITLGAFLKAPAVILGGDHQQLPPTVLSSMASRGGLSQSLFERLLDDHGEGCRALLVEQYRMNETIMNFSSREMYQGALRANPTVANRSLRELARGEVDAPPIIFLDTAGRGYEEECERDGASYSNPGEAELIAQRVRQLVSAGLAPTEIGVIAPYSAQVALLREKIEATDLEIDTVDAFQGREKEAILLTFTRSNSAGQLGFLSDLRRLNVALTRPKRHLFLVGDSACLGQHPAYARLQDYVQAAGGYRSVWEWSVP